MAVSVPQVSLGKPGGRFCLITAGELVLLAVLQILL